MSFLDELSLLSSLSQEEKQKLELFCQEKFLNKADELFKEWDEANSMYLLATWKIEIYKNIYWEEAILWEIKAEEILWEMALFWWQWKRMASARAVEDTKLVTILSFSIEEITRKHPDLMKKIEDIINARESENRKKIKY